jgi:hypothetical protein
VRRCLELPDDDAAIGREADASGELQTAVDLLPHDSNILPHSAASA